MSFSILFFLSKNKYISTSLTSSAIRASSLSRIFVFTSTIPTLSSCNSLSYRISSLLTLLAILFLLQQSIDYQSLQIIQYYAICYNIGYVSQRYFGLLH